MSIHLHSVPLPLDSIEKSSYLEEINTYGDFKDFKVKTVIDDMDLLVEILDDSLLGFKNKRALTNFRDNGEMYFYFVDDIIEIFFTGKYSPEESRMFVENLNKEFLIRTNQYNEELYDQNENNPVVEEEIIPPKKFLIRTNMRQPDLIEEVRNESYLCFKSVEDLQAFNNIGQIVTSKNENGTYDIVFVGDYNEALAKDYVKSITEEYSLKVQEQTYLKVLENAKKENYSIESEIIDENDSIILTLNVDR